MASCSTRRQLELCVNSETFALQKRVMRDQCLEEACCGLIWVEEARCGLIWVEKARCGLIWVEEAGKGRPAVLQHTLDGQHHTATQSNGER